MTRNWFPSQKFWQKVKIMLDNVVKCAIINNDDSNEWSAEMKHLLKTTV